MKGIDFKYDANFDLEIGRDFYKASQLESDIQLLKIRLLGANPDFTLRPIMCASLEEYIGENNDMITGNKIINSIARSLTNDGAFVPGNLSTSVYPIDYSILKVNTTYIVNDKGKSEYISDVQELRI